MNIKILRNLAIFMALNYLILPNSEAMTENDISLSVESDMESESKIQEEKSDKKKTFYKNPKALVPVGLFGLTVFGLYYHRNSIFGDRNRSKVKNGTANLKVKDEIKNSK